MTDSQGNTESSLEESLTYLLQHSIRIHTNISFKFSAGAAGLFNGFHVMSNTVGLNFYVCDYVYKRGQKLVFFSVTCVIGI